LLPEDPFCAIFRQKARTRRTASRQADSVSLAVAFLLVLWLKTASLTNLKKAEKALDGIDRADKLSNNLSARARSSLKIAQIKAKVIQNLQSFFQKGSTIDERNQGN